MSTAADLLRYHQALRSGRLLSEESWAAMRRVEPGLDNGLSYIIGTSGLGPFEGNMGRFMGHVSANLYFPERALFLVLLHNQGDAPVSLQPFFRKRYGIGE